MNCPSIVIQKQLRLANRTVVDWSSFCREVVFDHMIKKKQLGDIEEVVEIDESKFGRQYHRSYSKVPKQLLRDNANFIVLFKQDETNLKHVYNEHCSGDMSYSEFKDFCTSFMAASGEVLGELIKAKENIKRKYTALKQGKADIHSLVSETLSPIIEPLEKIKHLSPPIELKEDNNIEDSFKINDWFKSYDIDKTYGPKIRANGSVHLGKKEINLVDNTLTIEDISYPLTQGLGNLLFSKNPKLYTKNDLDAYKSILTQTSAYLTADEKKIKQGGNKYHNIIQNLFRSGRGLSMKLQKHNLVYWNDPNELVDRLRLLLASKAAAFELHKPARKNYTRRRVNVYGKNDLWQADLVEMIPYSKKNKGYKYILCVIDCFTKFAWAIALKSKTAKEVSSAMSKILIKRAPKLLQLDNGKEFYNSTFDELMSKYNIHKYSTYSTMKACIVERFNRTLKEKMFKEFTARGSHEWISILPSLINEYNNSKHRTIGMTPVQADANPTLVEIKHRKIINSKIKFNVGDNVRVSTYKGVFAKGYLPSWSTEIFKIVKINETLPTTYQLQDYTGKPIAGCFYSEEILKTNYPNDYLVEKIIPIDMNVFGSSQSGETKKNISNLEQIVKSYSNKFDKLQNLLEENHKSVQIQEEQIEAIQLTCVQIAEHMTRGEISLQSIKESIEGQAIMSSSILDMQCVLGVNNKYMIKEMSIVDTETWATQHWIFKHSKSMEDNKSRKTNKWLERNYHQLSIDYGDVEYEEVGKILNSLKFTCIYVKGEQKKQVLMEYIPHVALINIEDLGCPRLDQICDDETLPCCIFHMEFNPKQCTFYKVFAIRKWFINNS
ncbi:hypothetical protein QTP88_000572 [Uroleucon formosanum]